MNKKILIISFGIVAIAVICISFFVLNKSIKNIPETESAKIDIRKKQSQPVNKTFNPNLTTTKQQNKAEKNVIETDLYNEASSLPLYSVTKLSNISHEAKNAVKKIIDSQNNIYMANKNGDKLFFIIENQENIRHGIDFIEISNLDGQEKHSVLGYSDKMQDSDNDIWEYDKSSDLPLPVKHTKFDKNGDVEFIEIWNYDSDNPIKYEMKNGEGKVLSIRKETQSGDSDLRIENLIYDTDGNTKINVSATFEGADIKRFTYYNADKPSDNISIFSEYTDGIKTKEMIYSSELKLKNTYNSNYNNGIRTEITVLDENNEEVEKYKQISD